MTNLSNFHYQITGPKNDAQSAPKLVFLHGVMGFSANWRRIAKAFESEYQVLVFDQRGHGRSFQPTQGYQPSDYAQDLQNIIDELGWEKINLVGHSMGGRVAFHFAAKSPERVQRLVIEDIGPDLETPGTNFVIRLIDSVPTPFPSRRAAKEWFDTVFLQIFAGERKAEALAAYLYANLTENENGEAIWRFYEPGIRATLSGGDSEARATNHWSEVTSLSMPTLLVRGEYSQNLPRDLYEEVLRRNRRIEGVEIKGSGHWIHSDQPELFIEVVCRFLRDEPQISAAGLEATVLTGLAD